MPIISLSTTAVVAAVYFGLQGYQAWRNKKCSEYIRKLNFEYEKNARERNIELSKKLLQQMLDARKDIAEEERKEAFELLQLSHNEAIKEIAEKASFYKWPLYIHPIVIRNDFPLDALEDIQHNNVIEPVHVIIAPTRDKSFRNSVDPVIMERLNSSFLNFYGSRNFHRVIFYKDVWIDETLDADETIVRNIYSRTKCTPTILISFKVKKDKLILEISHWGINGYDKGSESNGSVFCQSIDLDIWGCEISRNQNYSLADIEIISTQVVDSVSLITGLMVDKLMWYRYQLAPVLPNAIKNGIVNLQEQDIPHIYKFYQSIFSESLEGGLISRFYDYKKILKFCNSVDIPFENGANFMESFLGKDKISTFNAFPDHIKYYYLCYIGANKKVYYDKSLIQDFFHLWLSSTLINSIIKAVVTDPEYSFKSLPTDFCATVWENYWNSELLGLSRNLINESLENLKSQGEVFMPRIEMREYLIKKAKNAIVESIIPKDCDHIVSKIIDLYSIKYKTLLQSKVESLIPQAKKVESIFKNIDLTFDLQKEMIALYNILTDKLVTKLQEINLSRFIDQHKPTLYATMGSIYGWGYKAAEDWIEYHFLGNDVIKSSLTESERETQDNRLVSDLNTLCMEIRVSFINQVRKIDMMLSPSEAIALESDLSSTLRTKYIS